MTARFKTLLAAIAAATACLLVAGEAMAAGCGCTPPTPPTPPPPNCCAPPGHTITVPGVNVYVNAAINVNASVSAQVGAQAAAWANGSASGSSTVFFGGGGGGGYLAAAPTGFVQGLNVEGGGARRSSYEATRTRIRKVIIEAVCIDDRDVPHPASQATPDRDIDDHYEGELYRCIAGTHMQATIADYDGRIAFDHGQTLACAKGDALYHIPAAGGGLAGGDGAQVVCRPQKPARDCNERSLLRRFGAGVKILTMISIEKYTAYREESVQSSTASSLSLDGGVGGVMY